MDEQKIKQVIPAKFIMISGSEDKQTSADVFNVYVQQRWSWFVVWRRERDIYILLISLL